MSFLFKSVVAGALCLIANSVMAQLSQGGSYFGKIGTGDIVVLVGKQDSLNLMYLDTSVRNLDIVATGLNSSNSSTGVSPRGRSYSFQIRDGVARGTYGGVSFSASKEPFIGDTFKKAGGYSGVIQDERGAIGVAIISFFASGKVLLVYSSSSGGEIAGIGQVSSAGQVTIPMTDGSFYSFSFRPDPMRAITDTGYIAVNGRAALQYLFFSNAESRMVNISTRSITGAGAPMIAGFVITTGAKTVLIRGIGPTLTQFGVQNSCPDPQLFLYSGQSVIASNTDWMQSPAPAEIVAASGQVGAFPLPNNSRDAVLLVTLEPGAYTVQVATQGATGGEALVEVYQVN